MASTIDQRHVPTRSRRGARRGQSNRGPCQAAALATGLGVEGVRTQPLPSSHDLNNLVYDTLFWSQGKEDPQPWLAERADPSPDHKSRTVKLRPNVEVGRLDRDTEGTATEKG